MKALKNVSLVALAMLFAATAAFAAVKPGKKLAYSVHAMKDSQKIMLVIENEMEDAVEIQILDEAHQVVFQETKRNAKEISKVYNLESFAQGMYYVHLKSGDFETESPVYIGPRESPIYPLEVVIVGMESNKVRLGFANAFADVAISVADASGNALYSDLVHAQHGNYLYNLDSLAPGIYYVNVSCGDKTFTQSYAVEK